MFGMVLSLMMSIGWAEIDLNDAGVEDFKALATRSIDGRIHRSVSYKAQWYPQCRVVACIESE